MQAEKISIELPKMNIQTIEVVLIGDTPLICHAWSEKAKKAMREKQQKKATAGREIRNPEQEFLDTIYRLTSDEAPKIVNGALLNWRCGFPAIAIKSAMVTSCTSIQGITKVMARQAFHVSGEKTPYVGNSASSGEFIEIQGGKPRIREDMVRVGIGKAADLRYRAEFWPWFMKVMIRYNANVMSAEQVANALNTAGFGVGVGEWRSEKDGMNGLFHVAVDGELENLNRKAA